MKIDTKNLQRLLNTLEIELKKNGNGAENNISALRLKLLADENEKNVINLLTILKSSAKIMELADFTPKEEKLWLDVWAEASRLLELNAKL
ncbi:MAG: hypothetical protein V4508_10665 [Pseudomonadota bacterium]